MKPNLHDITLLSYDGVDPECTALVLQYCAILCDFAAVRLLSFRSPVCEFNYDFIQIPKMNYREAMRFEVKEIYKYVDTPFCLLVQPDGFINCADKWSDKFKDFDMIGAPWPADASWVQGNKRVGNTGFCLRSKRFLEETAKLDYPEDSPNGDVFVCVTKREELESKGMKFAPVEIASRFSQELSIDEIQHTETSSFGFHRYLAGKDILTYE